MHNRDWDSRRGTDEGWGREREIERGRRSFDDSPPGQDQRFGDRWESAARRGDDDRSRGIGRDDSDMDFRPAGRFNEGRELAGREYGRGRDDGWRDFGGRQIHGMGRGDDDHQGGRGYGSRWESGAGDRGGRMRDDYGRDDHGYRGSNQAGIGELGGRSYGMDRSYGGQSREGQWSGERGYGGMGRVGHMGAMTGGMHGNVQSNVIGDASSRSQSTFGARGGQAGQRRYPKGPKGYKRSDERIKEDVCDNISQCDDLDSSEIEVNVANGEVTLTGTVPDRQMKFLAEQLCENVPAVTDVTNNIRVKRSDTQQHAQSNGHNGANGNDNARRTTTAKA